MNLYLITKPGKVEWDTFDSAVVAATDDNMARNTHPSGSWDSENVWEQWGPSDQVVVKKIGKADDGVLPGVICASFNAS